MNATKTLSAMFVALSLLVGSGSVLADPDHGHGRGHEPHDRDGWRDRDRHEHWERRYYSDRDYHGHPRWARGYRYDGPMYIVNDYPAYRLAPPPYGYRWVRSDDNYLLVSIGDNMILDLVIR